jgi:uncharacterized protein YraI
MNIKHFAAATAAMTLMTAGSVVQAQPQSAVTARPENLRAGPAPDYPMVAVLPAGFPLSVQGCLPEYTWCDVIAGQSRGWMYAGSINYYYQNRYVPVINYGAVLGIGALAFVLNDYWGNHYRDRRFYGERQRWEGRRFAEPRYYPQQRPGYSGPGYSGPRYAPGGSTPVPRADGGWRGERGTREVPNGSTPIPRPSRPPRNEVTPSGSTPLDPRANQY